MAFRTRIGRLVGLAIVSAVVGVRGQESPARKTFDHAVLNDLLRKHVDENGRVDYMGLHADRAALQQYTRSFAAAPLAELSRDEKLALLINAYNAFTLELILEHWDGGRLKSIRDLDRPWDTVRWTIGGRTYSLDQIEHEQIRPVFKEPRIHFVLVCAAVGCPMLRHEAYRGDRLEAQLEEQTKRAHASERWFSYDAQGDVVRLTKLYDWYGGDFVQAAGSVLAFAARYAPKLAEALAAGRTPRIQWIEYDWGLNGIRGHSSIPPRN